MYPTAPDPTQPPGPPKLPYATAPALVQPPKPVVPYPVAPAPVFPPVDPEPEVPEEPPEDLKLITDVSLANTGTATEASLPVTFGQPFKPGDFKPASQSLYAKVGSSFVPVQIDQISSHKDGSARSGVLSVELNNVQPQEARTVSLYAGSKSTTLVSAPIASSLVNGWDYVATVSITGTGAGIYTARPRVALLAQMAALEGVRLNGLVAQEIQVKTPLINSATGAAHPHLVMRFDVRIYTNGSIRTDIVFENNFTYVAAPGNITYSVIVKNGADTVLSQASFTHYHHARWHKVVWFGKEVKSRVKHNQRYFLDTNAIQNYDLTKKPTEAVLARQESDLNSSQTGLMESAFLATYFGMTGGRWEIGPLPRWSVLYFLSQDDRAKRAMLVNADASASVPIHYRDEKTGQPVRVTDYPTMSLMYGSSTPALPRPTGTTRWEPDTAHQGSFSYLPYLVTGDAFYLDELTFWASWNIGIVDPNFRQQGKGIIRFDQTRGFAWAMRALWEAKVSVPDNHPLKAYFTKVLEDNLTTMNGIHVVGNANVSPLGAIGDEIAGTPYRSAPWQNDFLCLTLSQMVQNGETSAKYLLDWISRFTVGRFNQENNGLCPALGPGYWWEMRGTDGKFTNSWSVVAARNYPSEVGKACSLVKIPEGAYPDSAGAYADNARASLASMHNAGIADAKATFVKWKAMTPGLENVHVGDPTWAIVPRD